MNKLTVLGGSAAGIGTGQGCSGYLLEIDDTALVLDLGPSTVLELRKHVDYRTLDGIVISHLHMDHVLDLFILRFMLSYNPVKADRKIPLFLPPGGLEFMAKAATLWSQPDDNEAEYFAAVYDMQEYDPAQALTIGNAEITFTPTVHPVPCWAMRVHPTTGDDLLYTADTGTAVDLTDFSLGVAVMITDSAAVESAPEEMKANVHMDARAAAELAQAAGVKHLVLSHQWEELDPMANAALARETFTGRLSVAIPGLTVTW